MYFVEDARLISKSRPSVCWKIRYNSRSDTAEIMPRNWRSSITAGQRHVQRSGTPQGGCPGAIKIHEDTACQAFSRISITLFASSSESTAA